MNLQDLKYNKIINEFIGLKIYKEIEKNRQKLNK